MFPEGHLPSTRLGLLRFLAGYRVYLLQVKELLETLVIRVLHTISLRRAEGLAAAVADIKTIAVPVLNSEVAAVPVRALVVAGVFPVVRGLGAPRDLQALRGPQVTREQRLQD